MVILCAAAAFAHASTPEQHFLEKVKPLLDSRCISCHGPDKIKGALRLDSRAAALKGGENGPAVVPGKPAESLLLQAVMHSRKELEMPPKEKLTTNDIAMLQRWIEDGAPWPDTPTPSDVADTKPGERLGNAWEDKRNPIVRIFGGQRLDLWSVKPLHVVQPEGNPLGTSGDARIRNGIDGFVFGELRKNGLAPAREADKRTLARRLYFDLTGLPPTPAEISEFINDTRPDAYERLVDQLLASPRYGEHMARQWMDVIRYSDSNGFDWDEFRPRAWRFRDYLIRSFNADKAFDQLVREQLAGDELVDGPPKNAAEQDALIGTGYLRMGPQDNSAALFNEQSRARSELLADLTETTSSAFLGLTMACCRCHDHKYDPLSQADHFRMRAFFEPVKYGDDVPLDVAEEQEEIRTHNEALAARTKPLKQKRDALLASAKTRLRAANKAKLTVEERTLLDSAGENPSADLKAKVAAIEKKLAVKDKDVPAALSPDEKKQFDDLASQIEELNKGRRTFTLGLLATDTAEKVPVTKILYQGDHKAERDPVKPGFISILDPNPAELTKPRNAKTTGRRLTLANWIVSTNNPLTARVFVNRIWQAHFGRGLVTTPNDFGLAGARPSHPELLDWLAQRFIDGGWSVKKLHRLIVTSATYKQGSTAVAHVRTAAARLDSENALLWRQNLRRATAEQLRDSLLSVSGTLVTGYAGPPIWPDLPPEVLQANPAFLDDNAEKTKGWYASKTNQNVRSVFLVQKRTVRVPFMETFDLPENSASCPRRNESIVAPQALSLLNSPLSLQAARDLAARVSTEAGPDSIEQIQRLFTLALQRPPMADERDACLQLLKSRNLTELCRAVLNLNEFIYVD